jgi:hypothetical protein
MEWQEAGRCSIMRSLTECYKDDQIKVNEMGGACCTRGKDEKCTQNFGQKA